MSDPASGRTSSSSRARKRAHSSSPKETLFSHVLSLLPVVAVIGFSLFCAAPWYFASTPWVAQYWLVTTGIGMVAVLLVEIVRRLWTPKIGPAMSIPVISLSLAIAAGYAYVQSLPLFDGAPSQSTMVPASIRLQRWFLGADDLALDKKFELHSASAIVAEPNEKPADSIASESNSSNNGIDRQPFRLAISVEPLHTHAAIGSLVLAAALVWIGSVCFTSPRWQISLLLVITIMGVVMGMLGLMHVLSWQKVNWLGLSPGNSFATFVSRNSAGGFLNVCLSAALGLASWTFIRPRNPNEYFDVRANNPLIEFFRRFEAGFARLNTPQIASVFGVAFLLACVACTTSRGATIGGIAACLVVLMLSGKKGHGNGRVIFAAVVVSLGLSLILFFEFDERISKRFEELLRIEGELKDGRSYIWGIASKAFTYFIATGSGLGTFHYSYLPFQNPRSEGWYYHAESMVAQTLVEFGFIGFFVIVAIVLSMFRITAQLNRPVESTFAAKKGGIPVPQYLPAYVTSLALLVSLGIHSLVDFPLVIPAVFIPAALLTGMVSGIARAKRAWLQSPEFSSSNLSSSWGDDEKGMATSDIQTPSRTFDIDSSDSGSSLSRRTSGRNGRRSGSLNGESTGASRRKSSRSRAFDEVESLEQQQLCWERFAYKGNSPVTLVCCLGFGLYALLLMGSSLASIDAMQRCDDMAAWVKTHEKLPRAQRIASPSSYLVGLWAGGSIPITQAPAALRVIGDSVLYEFRSERFESLEQEAEGARKVSWEETSPLLINALLNGLIQIDSESKIKKTSIELAGGEKQLARWDKAFELISKGRQSSPLDWRLAWGEVLLDRKLTRSQQLRHIELAGILARHRADNTFQIGVLAREAGDSEIAMKQWRHTLQISGAYATRIASIIAIDTPDDEIPIELFSDKMDVLKAISLSPFSKDKFPKSNALLWEKMEKAAEFLPKNESVTWLWFSEIAANKEDFEKELDCLKEATSRQPMNRNLRMRWAERLAANNKLDEAIEQAEFCRTLAPDDAQVLAFIKRWTAVRDEKR